VLAHSRLLLVLASSTLLLAACDLTSLLGDDEAKFEARREAEGKAIGGGCRYSARSIEDCYERNPKASKAYIFAGWRDMDAYMRENNVQAAAPEQPEAAPAKTGDSGAEKPKEVEAKPAGEPPKAAGSQPTPARKTADAPKEGLVAPKAKMTRAADLEDHRLA
jgi:cell division protein FtsN